MRSDFIHFIKGLHDKSTSWLLVYLLQPHCIIDLDWVSFPQLPLVVIHMTHITAYITITRIYWSNPRRGLDYYPSIKVHHRHLNQWWHSSLAIICFSSTQCVNIFTLTIHRNPWKLYVTKCQGSHFSLHCWNPVDWFCHSVISQVHWCGTGCSDAYNKCWLWSRHHISSCFSHKYTA